MYNKLILLAAAAADPTDDEQPIWALQGGNARSILNGVISYFTEVWWKERQGLGDEADDMMTHWCFQIEKLAEEIIPGKVWNASALEFFSVPSEVIPQYSRDCFGNETAFWIEEGEVKFAKRISILDVRHHKAR